MYKGKLGHVKELLLAYQELRRASAEMNSMSLVIQYRLRGQDNKEIREELSPIAKQMEERSEIYSVRAYTFRAMARTELEKHQKAGYSHFLDEDEPEKPNSYGFGPIPGEE